MKEKISEILLNFSEGKLTINEATQQILDLFIDKLDDEDSEIYKLGKEIAEMPIEEFENNCKEIEKMLSKSKAKYNKAKSKGWI
jgi:predicted transcriptional regulator